MLQTHSRNIAAEGRSDETPALLMHSTRSRYFCCFRISQQNGAGSSETGANCAQSVFMYEGSEFSSLQHTFSGFGVLMYPPSPQTPDILDKLRQLLMDEGDAFMVDLA